MLGNETNGICGDELGSLRGPGRTRLPTIKMSVKAVIFPFSKSPPPLSNGVADFWYGDAPPVATTNELHLIRAQSGQTSLRRLPG